MINLTDCIEIGLFTRSHGYKGDLILKLKGFNFDEIIDMEWVFVLIDGLPVPFFIGNFSERTPDSLFVNLNDINSIDKTKELLNAPVYIEKKVFKDLVKSKPRFTQMLGYKVIDSIKGPIGVLDSIIENPHNPLFRILNNKQEILLPLQDEFIIKVDDSMKEIVVSCPSGLLEL